MKNPDLIIVMEDGMLTSITAVDRPDLEGLRIAIVEYAVDAGDLEYQPGIAFIPQLEVHHYPPRTEPAYCSVHKPELGQSSLMQAGYLSTVTKAIAEYQEAIDEPDH